MDILGKFKTAFAVVLATASTSVPIMADEVETTQMNITLNNGQTLSVVLSNSESFLGPQLNDNRTKLIVDGSSYSLSEVKEIRFEKVMVDGIDNIERECKDDESVYDLQGRRVGSTADGTDRLSKGIYIIRGHKVIVR